MSRAFKTCHLPAAILLLAMGGGTAPAPLAAYNFSAKLDRLVEERSHLEQGTSRVIIQATDPVALTWIGDVVHASGGALGRCLRKSASQVAVVPNSLLARLAEHPLVSHVSLDRVVAGAMERTGATVGATKVRHDLGYDGAGIRIALIDSGIAATLDDLADANGGQRVVRFVDFVNHGQEPYDDYGHGTHVAGIVAGNGFDSGGARSGIAPAAQLVVLKVLDQAGHGYVSDVIAAIDYAIEQRDALHIRVINLSVATGVFESYNTDPLAQAALRAVNAGIVVVTAAGNAGHDQDGHTLYGGITSPGNAPWVLTVGASSHMGTVDRSDDTIASFSSRGPGAIDAGAKPDLLAPGVGIESLSNPQSALYHSMSKYLLRGVTGTPDLPYLSLSGTSMAAPVVTGTIALMLQANPALTPNEVKAILEYTAEAHAENDPLTQGAGYLNAKGAVELARYLSGRADAVLPDTTGWSRRFMWGNRLVQGGMLTADANAWSADLVWGSPSAPSGALVTWGIICTSSDCTASNAWTNTGTFPNVVWGSLCGGANCGTTWTLDAVASGDGETVVWGTGDEAETVVWGTSDGETVVWGTDGETETVVWGTSCSDLDCAPVIWKRP